MADLLTFSEAIARSTEMGQQRHLLLGNGFSIACRPESFRYGKLFKEADFSALSIEAKPLFELLGTADFEQAIEALRVSAEVLDLYKDGGGLIERVSADADALKEALAEVLARKHPDNVGEIEVEEYASARRFLANFDASIYTVNYDLLLYWTLMQSVIEPSLKSDDGFRSDPDDEDTAWVVWDGYEGHKQRIFYLHGGLHLYDSGSQLQKITWSRTGIPLIDQIRSALAENVYPHVITEGTSKQKLARIEHSPFLHRGLKSLNSCGGALFIYGHSLAANDAHVLARIENSKVLSLYVSLHGDPDSKKNRKIRERAKLMIAHRERHEEPKPEGRRKSLEVLFYDADSASVWSWSSPT